MHKFRSAYMHPCRQVCRRASCICARLHACMFVSLWALPSPKVSSEIQKIRVNFRQLRVCFRVRTVCCQRLGVQVQTSKNMQNVLLKLSSWHPVGPEIQRGNREYWQFLMFQVYGNHAPQQNNKLRPAFPGKPQPPSGIKHCLLRNNQAATFTGYETCTLWISHGYWPNKKNCRLIELENHWINRTGSTSTNKPTL